MTDPHPADGATASGAAAASLAPGLLLKRLVLLFGGTYLAMVSVRSLIEISNEEPMLTGSDSL